MSESKTIKFIIDSRLDLLSWLSKAVKGICADEGMNKNGLYQLELCLVEVVSNVIIHAYNCEAGHEIEVIVSLNHDHVHIQVSDTGKKFPECIDHALFNTHPVSIDAFPASAMGLFMIHKLVDKVIYTHREGKNVTSLLKRFSYER